MRCSFCVVVRFVEVVGCAIGSEMGKLSTAWEVVFWLFERRGEINLAERVSAWLLAVRSALSLWLHCGLGRGYEFKLSEGSSQRRREWAFDQVVRCGTKGCRLVLCC